MHVTPLEQMFIQRSLTYCTQSANEMCFWMQDEQDLEVAHWMHCSRVTIDKAGDENKIPINTRLFGNDQLHLETNKNYFSIVHDFMRQTDRL